MSAMLVSIAFTGAVALAAGAVVSTLNESRSRIADAFRGRPLRRLRPVLSAGA